MNYYEGYINFKQKYLKLKNQKGGKAYCKNNISNVAVIILNENNKNQILLLRDIKNRLWMTPGGGVDSKDLLNTSHACWKAISREYKEETSYDLPHLSDLKSFDYGSPPNTRIFIGMANPHQIKFSPTNETDAYMWVNIDDVLDKTIRVKSYVFSSTKMLREKGLI